MPKPQRKILLPPRSLEKKRNPLVVFLVMLVILAAGYFISSRFSSWSFLKSQLVSTDKAVTIQNFAFSPSELSVSVGTKIIWKNLDSAPHTVTASTSEGPKSGTLQKDQSFEYTASTVGTVDYVCGIHSNMKAKLIVTAAPLQAPAQSTFTVVQPPTPAASLSGPGQSLWAPLVEKKGFTATDSIALDFKISQIDSTVGATVCPPRPANKTSCPVGQHLATQSGTDSCGNYSASICVPDGTPPVQVSCTRPVSVDTCPVTYQLVNKSASDNCGAYTYRTCEPISTIAPQPPIEPAPPPHGAAEFYCFDDPIASMSDDEWEIICEAKDRGIISGTTQGDKVYFYPGNPINRAEAAKIVTLGILKSLGKLNDRHFYSMEEVLKNASNPGNPILFTDILYDIAGKTPWFAHYVALAQRERILGGYPDKSFKPGNSLNHAEAYRLIVETGRVSSQEIDNILLQAIESLSVDDLWYEKYVRTLDLLSIRYSDHYAASIIRKDFMKIVMDLLHAVGL